MATDDLAGGARVQRVSLTGQAVEKVKTMVARLNVGDRLPTESELAKTLGVGRSTVREAVQILAHLGLVESRQGAGTFVTGQTVRPELISGVVSARVEEVFEVRSYLECIIVRLACQRRTQRDIASMRDAQRQCRASAAADDLDGWLAADDRFHAALAQATGNRLLTEIVVTVRTSERAATATVAGVIDVKSTNVAHARLLRFITERNEASAVAGVEAQMRGTVELFTKAVAAST